MPAKSEKQRRYLFAKFGKAWVKRHHFDHVESAQARKGGKALRDAARSRRKR